MQTFLPDQSFVRSMEFLDQKRLGKQRVEAAQILEILLQKPILPRREISLVPLDITSIAWKSHPAVLMWSGHEEWLKLYFACSIGEWCSRGYVNNLISLEYDVSLQPKPEWLGHEPFHQSHRSNLIRKNPLHYRKFWPEENATLPYFWPTDFQEKFLGKW